MVVKGKTKSVRVFSVVGEMGTEEAAKWSSRWLQRVEAAFLTCLEQAPNGFLCDFDAESSVRFTPQPSP